ncbi:unnamed protein product, partial [Protopolystoma xenopodis]
MSWRRAEVYAIFEQSASPFDLASLLLRCIASCASYNSSSAPGSLTGSYFASGSGSSLSAAGWPDDESRAEDSTQGLQAAWAMNGRRHGHGLLPRAASDLLFAATRLQYALPGSKSSAAANHGLEAESSKAELVEDWMHILCHARQLFTYRVVIQLLLPDGERRLLIQLLRLFRRISAGEPQTRMHAENLARCAALSVFGSPEPEEMLKTQYDPTRLQDSGDGDSKPGPLAWRIDTLVNLIGLVDQLDALPGLVYAEVRCRLRARLGHSPIAKLPPTPSVAQATGSFVTGGRTASTAGWLLGSSNSPGNNKRSSAFEPTASSSASSTESTVSCASLLSVGLNSTSSSGSDQLLKAQRDMLA